MTTVRPNPTGIYDVRVKKTFVNPNGNGILSDSSKQATILHLAKKLVT